MSTVLESSEIADAESIFFHLCIDLQKKGLQFVCLKRNQGEVIIPLSNRPKLRV